MLFYLHDYDKDKDYIRFYLVFSLYVLDTRDKYFLTNSHKIFMDLNFPFCVLKCQFGFNPKDWPQNKGNTMAKQTILSLKNKKRSVA